MLSRPLTQIHVIRTPNVLLDVEHRRASSWPSHFSISLRSPAPLPLYGSPRDLSSFFSLCILLPLIQSTLPSLCQWLKLKSSFLNSLSSSRCPFQLSFEHFFPMYHRYFKLNMLKIQMHHLGPSTLLSANPFHAKRTRKNFTTCCGTDDPFMWLWFKYLLWLLNFKITLKKPSQVSINKKRTRESQKSRIFQSHF